MHALALEFTYLWKLNREHWLKVWPHICIWPQLWTGTSARTRAHAAHTHMGTWLWTAGSVCSASGSFLLLSVSHNDPCTVCVCTAPSSNSVHFRPIAIQAHSEAGFCEDAHTNPVRLGLRPHLEKQGPSSLRNQLECQKCTWYISPCVVPSGKW